jgi:ribosomal protein S18 acetylase RimI-like enzyme
VIEIRPAAAGDEDALATLDLSTWNWLTSPAPKPDPATGWTFFDEKTQPEDVLVATVDGEVAGYIKLVRPHPLAASDHVLLINGLTVDPSRRRSGIGRALIEAATAEARARGMRRLTLRVLGPNKPARRLYESAGFVVEGVQREYFFLEGEYVDDVLMALDLVRSAAEPER